MGSMLTAIEEVTAKRKADAAAAYDAALAAADVDPDVVAYLDSLDGAATERPASPADVVRLEKVLGRLGRTIADFKHDVGVRQQVARLRASLLTPEAEANLDAERQAADDACEAAARAAFRTVADGVPVEYLPEAAELMARVAVQLGSPDPGTFAAVGQAMLARDKVVGRVGGDIQESRSAAAAANRLERTNPRAFPPAA